MFNLLTTTIHRCIYSALSKDKRQHRNLVALTDNLLVGPQLKHTNGRRYTRILLDACLLINAEYE